MKYFMTQIKLGILLCTSSTYFQLRETAKLPNEKVALLGTVIPTEYKILIKYFITAMLHRMFVLDSFALFYVGSYLRCPERGSSNKLLCRSPRLNLGKLST